MVARLACLLVPAAVATAGYRLVLGGGLAIDAGVGRRVRPLGPIRVEMVAPRETVFDVIAAPYLGRTPRALEAKLEVLERGSDMVLAAHHTKVGRRTVTTVETVRFTPPERVDFRLVRGPVAHVVESYELRTTAAGTELLYTGEIGADLWALGSWWARYVGRPWGRTVAASLREIRAEAERRSG
jgi:Polyketide cyclase / dehydrase and lipid transport